jgi:hypothetical protein
MSTLLKVVRRILEPSAMGQNAKFVAAALWIYLSFRSHRLSLLTILGLPFIAYHVDNSYPKTKSELSLGTAKEGVTAVLASLVNAEEEILQLRTTLEQKVSHALEQVDEAVNSKIAAIAEANEKRNSGFQPEFRPRNLPTSHLTRQGCCSRCV